VPERDSRALWETLMLYGFQAGPSWTTILRKREAFHQAFQGFDPEVVARFGAADVACWLRIPASSAHAPRARRRWGTPAPIWR
jgi:DNA-3-methyladenine glycosylase I